MKSSKSSLFLIELIISILFFSLASAACIQLFVKSHLLDKKTQESNQIVMWSQNLSELWHAAEGELVPIYNRLLTDYPTENACILLTDNDSKLALYMNNDFTLCNPEDDTVTYRIELYSGGEDEAELLEIACINFFKDTDGETTLIYNLLLQQHTALERGGFQ